MFPSRTPRQPRPPSSCSVQTRRGVPTVQTAFQFRYICSAMNFRTLAPRAAAGMWLTVFLAGTARAQDPAVQRIASMVAIAVVEYGNGVDAHGHMTAVTEYKEAVDFLAEARAAAARLPSQRQPAVALLDSIIGAAQRQQPPADLAALEKRFKQTLGSDAATAFPQGPLNTDSGRAVYSANCVSCHGVRGAGDGPLARTLNPRPPALADRDVMRAVTPEIMYRKIEIGVKGTAMPGFAVKLSAADRWNVVAYLTELRHSTDIALGEGLYVQNCASCHGASGGADGPLTSSLSKLPPDLGSFAWQAQRSDSQLVSAIHIGVPGSPMPPIRGLSPADENEIVAYLRLLAIRDGHNVTAVGPDASAEPSRAAAKSLSLLEQSLSAARSGRTDDAAARATDAYMSFEPVETRSRPKNPGLILTMEQTYAAFKDAVKNSDVRR